MNQQHPHGQPHAYAKYVNHILNKSPSKTAYTFPKAERFSSPKKDELQTSVPFYQNQHYDHQTNTKPFNKTFQQQYKDHFKVCVSPQKSPFKDKNKNQLSPYCKKIQPKKTFTIDSNYVNKTIQRKKSRQLNDSNRFAYTEQRKRQPKTNLNQRYHQKNTKGISPASIIKNLNSKSKSKDKGKTMNRQKSKSERYMRPIQLSQRQINELYRQKDQILKNKLLQDSPIRKYKQTSRSRSKGSSQSKQKIVRTYTSYLQQIDHPSKHITPHGYYPIGTQINQNGKYVISNFKNIPSHSFGVRPNTTKPQTQNTQNKLFSRSPLKNQQKVYFGSDKISHLNSSLQRLRPSQKHIRPVDQIYVPFSQFGNISQNKIQIRRNSKQKERKSPIKRKQRQRERNYRQA